ncbi:MAG: universal stress protein [Proteobacteria bacterium]|nr:universal stress protein [Pseudomonadota bacterium]
MYQKILLTYDGSREGRTALCQGAEIALALKAQTHLLAVIRPIPNLGLGDGMVSDSFFESEQKQYQVILDEGVAKLAERGLKTTGHLLYGEPVQQIRMFAKEYGVDLIVVGHRHRSRLARWWSGSLNISLLDDAPCSLLIAVQDEEPESHD